MKRVFFLLALGGSSLAPLVSYAQTAASGPTFATVTDNIIAFFDSYVIPLLYALAFLFFLIGIVRYFFTGGEENRQKARPFVLWGLVGLVVIFALWGIVHLLIAAIPGA